MLHWDMASGWAGWWTEAHEQLATKTDETSHLQIYRNQFCFGGVVILLVNKIMKRLKAAILVNINGYGVGEGEERLVS